jgi:L-alanine-DL-glutamate epimerase-like enolase superfamily enzyme
MPGRRVRLFAGELHYRPQLRLHTASSGAIPSLRELYLVLEERGNRLACGAVRTNVEYLTGIPESAVRREVDERVRDFPWNGDFHDLRAALARAGKLSPTTRALVDTLIFDGLSRREGIPLCEHLGGNFKGRCLTNQTLFWSDDDTLLALAREYVARGFTDLKLRVAVEGFGRDLRRLQLVRDAFGDTIRLSIDANGHWSEAQAMERIAQLEPFALAYVEQPIAAGDWDAIARLAKWSPTPIMLDESLASIHDVQELARRRLPVLAHLKLAKLGGIEPVMAATRRLAEVDIPVMIGQMNEGTVATAAAVHCAMALDAPRAELYGADGLLDDPAHGLAYRDGMVEIAHGPGLGVEFNAQRAQLIWEKSV